MALLEALGKLADPARAAAALERELTHPQWQVRLAAAKALALSGRPASSTALSACRADYFAQVRSACETTLAALGKKK